MTDNQIIEFLRQSNYSKVIKGLYTMLPAIKKHVCNNSGTNDEAQDIFQDALVVLYKKVQHPTFKLTSSLQTYTTAIAKNLWQQELRRKKKLETTELTETIEESVPNENENTTLANTAFNLLGQKCKDLLILFYHKKISFKEIATQLDFSDEKVAKNQKYRCLQKAKENFNSLNSK